MCCFTAGVEENNPALRAAVVDGLDGLGLQLDPELNNAASKAARLISTDASPITIAVVPTNEGRNRPRNRRPARSRSASNRANSWPSLNFL